MPGIICAIRGGPSSQPTISTSIRLAEDSGEEIHFLYVVNLDFLTHSSSSKIHHITQEMREMGEFILLSAQEQAEQASVASQSIIRDGNVLDEIIAYCKELHPSYVILGRPVEDQESNNRFTQEILLSAAAQINQACEAKIVFPNSETDYSIDHKIIDGTL